MIAKLPPSAELASIADSLRILNRHGHGLTGDDLDRHWRGLARIATRMRHIEELFDDAAVAAAAEDLAAFRPAGPPQ
ncbi:MAG TPA: hypothetical protein VNE67_09200 [Acetobacteraceae bacterium]|nr:hypothetical protein [Acetobacteraceae bacterium]